MKPLPRSEREPTELQASRPKAGLASQPLRSEKEDQLMRPAPTIDNKESSLYKLTPLIYCVQP